MELDETQIRALVSEIVKRLSEEGIGTAPSLVKGGPLFSTIEEAIDAAETAQKILQDMGLEKRRKIIDAMREASRKNAEGLARLAHEETRMGRWEHKIEKNLLAAEKTPGVEDVQPASYTGDRGLTLVERAPFGVIAAVTPSTNPSSTVINNSISIKIAFRK